MASRIPDKTRDAMFDAYCEQQSVHYVARKCHIHRKTATRYKDKDNWDSRLADIKQQSQKKADYEYAKERGKYVRAIGTILNKGINEKG